MLRAVKLDKLQLESASWKYQKIYHVYNKGKVMHVVY